MIRITREITEMNIDLHLPRVIAIKGQDKNGKEILWHLKVTDRGRLVLI